MLAFVLRRLVQSLVVMLSVALIAFAMFRFIGDPVNQMVGPDTTEAEKAQIRLSLGLGEPVPVQFGRYIGRVLTLDFGISYQFRQSVTALFATRLPATLELMGISFLVSLLIGVTFGIIAAVKPYSAFDYFVTTFAFFGMSRSLVR